MHINPDVPPHHPLRPPSLIHYISRAIFELFLLLILALLYNSFLSLSLSLSFFLHSFHLSFSSFFLMPSTEYQATEESSLLNPGCAKSKRRKDSHHHWMLTLKPPTCAASVSWSQILHSQPVTLLPALTVGAVIWFGIQPTEELTTTAIHLLAVFVRYI